MVNLTVNGQQVAVHEDATLLQAVRAAGVELPTLCYHEGLAPYGACRLCMVAITAPYQAVVASCHRPVEEGLMVETDSPDAMAIRRLVLEFLLSRCPQSDQVRALAATAGVTASRFGPPPADRAAELCVLCGLCVRVCREAIGAAAIGFIGRGAEREVGPPFKVQSETCIGCGACAQVCPTGAVQMEDVGDKRILHTWNTTVTLHACPECGGFFAPEPTAFLKEMLPEIAELWALCPQCRRKKAAQQAPGVVAPLAAPG
jgi:bidirectional [NiFe] hydrogenase diaphorase subunit